MWCTNSRCRDATDKTGQTIFFFLSFWNKWIMSQCSLLSSERIFIFSFLFFFVRYYFFNFFSFSSHNSSPLNSFPKCITFRCRKKKFTHIKLKAHRNEMNNIKCRSDFTGCSWFPYNVGFFFGWTSYKLHEYAKFYTLSKCESNSHQQLNQSK